MRTIFHAIVGVGPRALRRAAVAALCLVILLAPGASFAQSPSSKPAAMDPSMFSAALSQMGPMYEQMTQSTIAGTLKAMEQPENVERMATFARRYYEALIKQGFSREEALQITAGAGNPGARFGR